MTVLDGPGATMTTTAPAMAWIGELRGQLRSGQRPTSVTSTLGVHTISYYLDDFDAPYALVGMHLPEGVYPDIHGTYGPLTALRIYYECQR